MIIKETRLKKGEFMKGFGCFSLYSCIPNTKFANRWYFHKTYETKAGAKAAIKRFREKHTEGIESKLIFKIICNPSFYCKEEEKITVYEEIEG